MAELVYVPRLVSALPAPLPCTCGGRRVRRGADHICCAPCCARELAAESYVMFFDMEPVLEPKAEKPTPWAAFLAVTTSDAARLMREGFHWDEHNVMPELSFINHNNDKTQAQAGFRYKRIWDLADRGPERLWRARLVVYGRDTPTLARFRISHVEPRGVTRAFVRSPRDRCDEHRGLVYYFSVERPELNVNAMYDDMPLEGWWPWPKKRGQ